MKPLSRAMNDLIEHPEYFKMNKQLKYYLPLIKWYAMRTEHNGVCYL
jgi:hypothetical protein